MRTGPEHGFGWRTQYDVSGVKVDVFASHARRSRVPRGQELVRQLGRGPLHLVDDVTFEWRAVMPGARQVTVRPNPNGTFAIEGRHFPQRTLQEAVQAWAQAVLDRRSPPAANVMPSV